MRFSRNHSKDCFKILSSALFIVLWSPGSGLLFPLRPPPLLLKPTFITFLPGIVSYMLPISFLFCVDHFFPKLWIFRQDRIDVPQKHRQSLFQSHLNFLSVCYLLSSSIHPDICHSETFEAVFFEQHPDFDTLVFV